MSEKGKYSCRFGVHLEDIRPIFVPNVPAMKSYRTKRERALLQKGKSRWASGRTEASTSGTGSATRPLAP
jgi:hypothetical protein